MKLEQWERTGLQYLVDHGFDVVGVIDTDEKLAGALGWEALVKRGLVHREPSDRGPVYTITALGRAALAPQ